MASSVNNHDRCGTGACVALTEHPDGVDFTSTLGFDKGRVTYTRAEVAQFIGDVKAGHYDRFLEVAPATV
jgi:hypothetical protein